MEPRSVTHNTFVVERSYDARPARVFAAFADPTAKARWFSAPPDWTTSGSEFDFRVGGREIDRSSPPGGPVVAFEARYYDIVPDQRIVFAYDLLIDGARISVSLTTIEFKPEGAGTRLVFTEQGAFLDGHDDPALREKGTRDLLDALDAELKREPANS